MRANESGSSGQQQLLSLVTHLGFASTFVGISEVVTHRNLELASRVSGVGLAEGRRDDYTIVILKIRVVENIESVPGKLHEVGMLSMPHQPPTFRQPQVQVCIGRATPGIAPEARGTVVKNGIVIIILSRGDVVGKARPSVKDCRQLRAEPPGIDENRVESVPAVEVSAAPVGVRVTGI